MRISGRRVDPLYALAAALFIGTLAFAAFTASSVAPGAARTGSVTDEGPGGTAVLRRWIESLGVPTHLIQGDRFAPDVAREKVLMILLASEPITPLEVTALRAFVERGGTLVVATESGLREALLLDALGIRVGPFAAGELDVVGPVAVSGSARRISIDGGREIDLGGRGMPVARTAHAPLAGVVREGSGAAYVIGSVAPFLSGQIADADNGRFVLGLVGAALGGGGAVAFDEYHHGAHPAPDVLAIIERTWPGRALLIGSAVLFGYIVLTGRRLGPAVPLEHRPRRSSLEHVRAFAGLVRRSGHTGIARERLRAQLRGAVARGVGMDPRTAPDRLFSALAQQSPERGAEARDLDASLSRPLRDSDLLRTVRRIDELMRPDGR